MLKYTPSLSKRTSAMASFSNSQEVNLRSAVSILLNAHTRAFTAEKRHNKAIRDNNFFTNQGFRYSNVIIS